MNSKLVLLLVAVLCGVGAAFLVNRIKAGAEMEKDPILVAATDMPIGTVIPPQDVEKLFVRKDYLKGTAPLNSYNADIPAEVDKLKGKKLAMTLTKGEAVTEKHLTDDSITKLLPDGYRAITIPVSVDKVVAGYVIPGSKVDLITTYNKENKTIAQIFLQDVLVLAINTAMKRPDDSPAMANPTTCTLAVKPKDAARIALAQRLSGNISLMLRGLGEHGKEEKTEVGTLQGGGKDDDSSDVFTETVLVAKRNLEKGEKVEKLADLFEEKPMPEKTFDEAIFVKSLKDPSLKDVKLITVPVKQGTPIARSFLSPETQAPEKPAEAKRERHTMTIMNGPNITKATFEKRGPAWAGSEGEGEERREPKAPPASSGSEGK
jgi:pilus assembly protein CpaB